jgi:hypothetical protein
MPVKVKGMQDLKVEALTAAPLEIDWVQFK